jgi:hypothetical protein
VCLVFAVNCSEENSAADDLGSISSCRNPGELHHKQPGLGKAWITGVYWRGRIMSAYPMNEQRSTSLCPINNKEFPIIISILDRPSRRLVARMAAKRKIIIDTDPVKTKIHAFPHTSLPWR